MKLVIKKGTTSKLVQIFIMDTSQTDGSGLTGLAYDTGSLTAYYYRDADAVAVEISLITMTAGTWASGGFIEIDATNLPGWYQVGLPDAAIVTSAASVGVALKGAADMAPVNIEVQLVDYDPEAGADLGLSNLDATITSVISDTEDLQNRLPSSLASGRMSSDAVAISGSTGAADRLEASAETIVTAAAAAGTLSTTQMTTNLTEVTDSHYNGRIIIWTSGVLKDQGTDITAYVGSTKLLTYTITTEAPSDGDTFVIV